MTSHPRDADSPRLAASSELSGPSGDDSESSDWAPLIVDPAFPGQNPGSAGGTLGSAPGPSREHTQAFLSNEDSVFIELDQPEDEDSVPLPETLGGYLVGKRLGRGGMGEVFLAEHRSMGRTVALKILPAKWLGRAGSVQRFHEEIRAASRLMHPNIVTAFDAGQAEGIHFLAMEFVDGKTLSQVISEEGPMSVGDATSAIRQAAFALHHAHTAGIIHRDVKPGNLMRSREGTIKLLDLGLARFSRQWHNANESPPSDSKLDPKENLDAPHRDSSLPPTTTKSQPGPADSLQPISVRKRSLLGTLAFISPEQLEDPESADARSDQYSLGATLFYLLVGHPPFPGEMIDQIYGHRHGEIPNLMTYRQDVDLTLANIVNRMLAKSPAQRYGSMDEVARAMAPYDNDRSTPAWVLDFAQRKIDEDGSTANETSRTSGSTRHKTLSILGVDLGITHAATAVGLPSGEIQPGFPGMAGNRSQLLFRMAIAETAGTKRTGNKTRAANAIAAAAVTPGKVLFGQPAYELRQNHPHRVSHCQMMYFGRPDMLRQIGGRMCPPVITTALCLRHLVGNTLMNFCIAASSDPAASPGSPHSSAHDGNIDQVLGASWQRHESWPDAVAVTVPGCYDQLHRRAIYTAAKIAGLPSVRLIDRSVAIARFAFERDDAHGNSATVSLDAPPPTASQPNEQDSETVLYVGLTAQALDVAVIRRTEGRVEQIATAGHWHHSSIAWSSRLVEIIRSRLANAPQRSSSTQVDRNWLIHAAKVQIAGERAMNSLLLLPQTKVEIRHRGITEVITLTRQEWLNSCRDLIASVEQAISLAIARAGVSSRELSRCFVLSPILRLPSIRKLVFAGLDATTSLEFFDSTDAATGSVSCVAAELPGQRGGALPTHTRAAHTIGFVIADAVGKRKILPIIERGTATPARTNRQLGGTVKDEHLTLALVESSGVHDEAWQALGRHRIPIDASEQAPTRKIGFEVDINGLLSVHLERPDLGRTVRLPALPELVVSPDQWNDWREWIEDQA